MSCCRKLLCTRSEMRSSRSSVFDGIASSVLLVLMRFLMVMTMEESSSSSFAFTPLNTVIPIPLSSQRCHYHQLHFRGTDLSIETLIQVGRHSRTPIWINDRGGRNAQSSTTPTVASLRALSSPFLTTRLSLSPSSSQQQSSKQSSTLLLRSPSPSSPTSPPSSPAPIRWVRRMFQFLFLPVHRFLRPFIEWIMILFRKDVDGDQKDGTAAVLDIKSESGSVTPPVTTEDTMSDHQAEETSTPQAISISIPETRNGDETANQQQIEFTTRDIATDYNALNSTSLLTSIPMGDRWSISASDVDLTGEWKLVVTDEFKADYDEYLKKLGQSKFVRDVALAVVGKTTEELIQTDRGKSVVLTSNNVRGTWTRTFISSGTDEWSDANADDTDGLDFERIQIPIRTADGETVQAEAWWEDHGRVHVSWMRGVRKYGGGDFEGRRYLQHEDVKTDNEKSETSDASRKGINKATSYYICESAFHPNDPRKGINRITWKFERQ